MQVTDRDIQLRAKEADMIMNHPLFVETFDYIRDQLILELEEGDLTDEKVRDKIMMSLQNLKAIKSFLTQQMQSATLLNFREEVL